MPELPDVEAYRHAINRFVVGQKLARLELLNPFILRSVSPPVGALVDKTLTGTARIGKRIAFEFDDELFAVVHLMIAGRLRWLTDVEKPWPKTASAVFHFEAGRLVLTEASKKKRASLHLAQGRDRLVDFDRGGIEPLQCDQTSFSAALTAHNHTLKRGLTDPRILSGIGNAYSDEILHRAQLSPVTWTQRLDEQQLARLYEATRATLQEWQARLIGRAEGAFPDKVTAFRPEMAVHGKFKQPCPVCGTLVQRIVYASRETNYCPTCQTGGKLLADRSLSRLLHMDWPRSVEEMEALKAPSPD